MSKLKITIFRSGAIGDVIHSLPLCYMLRQVYGDNLELTYITSSGLKEVLSFVSCIDHILPLDLAGGLKGFIQGYQFWKSYSADIIINLHPHWRTNWLIDQASYQSLFVYRKRKDAHIHAWENFALSYFGDSELRPDLIKLYHPLITIPVLAAEEIWVRHCLTLHDKPILAIIPSVGLSRPHRAWPIHHWISLLQMFRDRYHIVLLGGADDILAADQIVNSLNNRINVHNLVNKLSLFETACLMKKSSLIIGGDTGPIHLAGASGAKVLSLFGPTSVYRHHPFGDAICLRSKYECNIACSDKACVEKKTNCMQDLSVQQVYNQVLELLNA